MNPCADLAQLNAMNASAPVMLQTLHADETQQWLARIRLLAWPYLDPLDRAQFETSLSMQFSFGDAQYPAKVRLVLHHAIAKAESLCGHSIAPTGAVIQPGEAFKAFTEIASVIKSASQVIFIIDPYMDEKALTEVAIVAGDGVAIRLLTVDGRTTPQLRAAASNWAIQHNATRPLEARIAPKASLHDRVIFVDQAAVWQLSQSIKDFAVRSPATVIPLDTQLLPEKQAAYEAIWKASAPL